VVALLGVLVGIRQNLPEERVQANEVPSGLREISLLILR
jgi:hypothetical protein